MHARDTSVRCQLANFRRFCDVGRQFSHKLVDDVTQLMQLLLARNVTGGAARILKILLTGEDLAERVRFRSVGRPHMDGEHETATPRVIVEDRFDRRVGENTPVPIELITYLNGWESRRQGPRSHYVPDRQFHVPAVEIAHLGGLDVRGSDRETRPSIIQKGRIDQCLESVFEWLRRIVAGEIGAYWKSQAKKRRKVRLEEAGKATSYRHH